MKFDENAVMYKVVSDIIKVLIFKCPKNVHVNPTSNSCSCNTALREKAILN